MIYFGVQMRKISEQELKEILNKHGKWLRGEENGERADLSSANLRSANLSSANLRYADLRSADLSYADLRSANLSSANLRYADLRSADLSYANLSYANLSSANLSSADLRSANLRYADLRYANGFKFDPIQVTNTKYFISILDDKVLWGCRDFTFNQVRNLTINDCNEKWDESELEMNKSLVVSILDFYRKGVN